LDSIRVFPLQYLLPAAAIAAVPNKECQKMGGGNNLRNDMLCTTFDPSTNRTSAGADWIRSQTCIFAGDLSPSQSLPSYLNCGPLPTPFLPPAGIISRPHLYCVGFGCRGTLVGFSRYYFDAIQRNHDKTNRRRTISKMKSWTSSI
jgi:hypothetical protein